MPGGLHHRARSATAWALSALIFVAPLALGGTRTDTQLPLAGAAFLLLMLGAWSRVNRGARLPWPVWGPLLLTGYGLVQLIGLPTDLLEALSPAGAAVRQTSLADLGAYVGAAHPISVDPAATWAAVFHQATFAAVLIVAVNLGKRRRHRILDTLIVTGGVITLIGGVHWGLGLTRIYGLYEASHRVQMQGFFSTFVNNNTLAGLLVLSTCIALGVLAGTNDELRQRTARTFGALSAVGVLLSGSRGGQLVLLLGLGLFAALAYAPSHRRIEGMRARSRGIARIALTLAVIAVAVAMALLPDWRALADAQGGLEVRLGIWEGAWQQAQAYWITGSGRGTFALVHPQFQAITLNGTVTHPENIALQLLTEWGVPMTAVAIGAGIGAWLLAVRAVGRATDAEHWGLLAGLAAVGIQQTVDFGLEAAGLSIPVAAALGLALGRDRELGPLGGRHRATAYALLALAITLGGLLAWRAPSLFHDQADAATLRVAQATDPQTARTEALAHPSDYLLAFNAAQARIKQQAPLPDVLRWLNRAMYLAPLDHRPHLVAARAFADAGRPRQAASEYRQALNLAPWWRSAIATEAVLQLQRPADLARVVTDNARARQELGNTLLARGRAEHARQTMTLLIDDGRDGPEARQIRARACLAADDRPCVAADADWLAAHDALALAAVYRAMLASRDNNKAAALQALRLGEATGKNDPVFLRAAIQIYARLGEVDGARLALDRLWLQVASRKRPASEHLALRARIETGFGDHTAALRAWQASLKIHPTLRATLAANRTARTLKRLDVAETILLTGLERWPGDPQLQAALRATRLEVQAPPKAPPMGPATPSLLK